VQAHISGEVGILDTVLLRVSSETSLPIFSEIGSYLTDKEQKNKFAEFFETRCVYIDICQAAVHRTRGMTCMYYGQVHCVLLGEVGL